MRLQMMLGDAHEERVAREGSASQLARLSTLPSSPSMDPMNSCAGLVALEIATTRVASRECLAVSCCRRR